MQRLNAMLAPPKIEKLARRPRMIIQGHRGFGGEVIENTVQAFEAAAKSNLDSIETDVFLTKDDVMVVCHGDFEFGVAHLRPLGSPPETPYEMMCIGLMTAEQLSHFGYRSSNGERIPLVTDLLRIFKGTNKVMNMEIKEFDPRIAPMLIDAFHKEGMLHQLFLSSFYFYHRVYASEHTQKLGLPEVPFGFLTYSVFDALSEPLKNLIKKGDQVTFSHYAMRRYLQAIPQVKEYLTSRGVGFNICFDGTKSEDMETFENFRFLHDLGIHTIITNCPTLALAHNYAIETEKFSQGNGVPTHPSDNANPYYAGLTNKDPAQVVQTQAPPIDHPPTNAPKSNIPSN